MALEQIEIERDDAIRATQPGADHALFGGAIHLLDAHDGAAGGSCACRRIGGRRNFGRVAVIMNVMVVIVMVVIVMIMRRLGGVPGDRLCVTAATPTAGGFRLGVVVDRQAGGEIRFHAAIQNPEEASGSSPTFRHR
jgi:uncharacterized membrane protein